MYIDKRIKIKKGKFFILVINKHRLIFLIVNSGSKLIFMFQVSLKKDY